MSKNKLRFQVMCEYVFCQEMRQMFLVSFGVWQRSRKLGNSLRQNGFFCSLAGELGSNLFFCLNNRWRASGHKHSIKEQLEKRLRCICVEKKAAKNKKNPKNFSLVYFQSTLPALHVSAPAPAQTAHVHRCHGAKGDYENWLGINCRYYNERDSSYLRRGKVGNMEARCIHLTI